MRDYVKKAAYELKKKKTVQDIFAYHYRLSLEVCTTNLHTHEMWNFYILFYLTKRQHDTPIEREKKANIYFGSFSVYFIVM